MTTGNGKERFAWEDKTRTLAESVISSVFPKTFDITWTADDERSISLDRKHGIDVISQFGNGQPLTHQVKVLSGDYTTITVETLNKFTHDLGDWDTCKADCLTVLYSDDAQRINRYAVIWRALVTMATIDGRLTWRRAEPTRASGAGSAFYYIQLSDILTNAPECVRCYGGDWGTVSRTDSRSPLTIRKD